MSRLYIGNIPFKVKENELENIFSKAGKVVQLIIKNNFGFIQFENERQANDAIRIFNGTELYGNKIFVEFAKTRIEKINERNSEKCFKCGELGHFAKECRKQMTSNNNSSIVKTKYRFQRTRDSPVRSFSNSFSSLSRSRSRSRSRSK